MAELVNDSVLGEGDAPDDDPLQGQIISPFAWARRRKGDPFNRFDSVSDSIPMASVKEKALSYATKRFPERKFHFVHFDNTDFLFKGPIMHDFLKEKSVRYQRLNAFNHEHYEWGRSHSVQHLRDGSVKITEPGIVHRYSLLVEWQGKMLFLFKLTRYEKNMRGLDTSLLRVGAVEDMNALKSLDKALLEFVRSKGGMDTKNDDGPRDVISWDEVVLPGNTVNEIRADIESFFASARLYHELGIPYKRGMILTGPPGNGKTLLCRIIASNFRKNFFEIIEPDRHTDNRCMEHMYRRLGAIDGGIICLEDLDTLFESSQVTLSGFLNILDGIKPTYGVLTIATTNRPERIDPALIQRPSRFDRKWIIDNPDEDCRRRLLRLHFRNKIDEALLQKYAEETEGWSAAYIKELYITAAFRSLGESSSVITPEHVRRAYELLASQRTLEKRNFNPAAKPVGFAG